MLRVLNVCYEDRWKQALPPVRGRGEQAVALCALVADAFWQSPPFAQQGCVPFAVSRMVIQQGMARSSSTLTMLPPPLRC